MRGVVSVAGAALLLSAVAGPSPAGAASGTVGSVQIVQAVPGSDVRVWIDGRTVDKSVAPKAVIGPYHLSPGKHVVTFRDASGAVSLKSAITVRSGGSTDVVLHKPASAAGAPVVNVYRTPRKAIGPGKSRVLVAHTAVVPPADVDVDGTKVFTNIANGEYAEADVPAGKHAVEILATGTTKDPILGPIDVTLQPQTVTMIYAVGSPRNGSMNVISHSAKISSDGTVVPESIDTGSAGLASGATVHQFSDSSSAPTSLLTWWVAAAGLAVLGGAWLAATASRSRGAHRAG